MTTELAHHRAGDADVGSRRVTGRLDALKGWPGPRCKEWTYHFAAEVCANPDTRALIVIGSLARLAQHANDVDLLYICRGGVLITANAPLDLDIKTFDAREVSRLLAKGHDLLGWALRFGYLLCERGKYWSHLRERWLHRSPLPDPHSAESRAVRAEEYYVDLLEMGDHEAANEQLVSALTHRAWARLLKAGLYPASRPELAGQLKSIGAYALANALERAREGDLLSLPALRRSVGVRPTG